MFDEPAITIRKTYNRNRSGQWMWRCNNRDCGWVGLGLGSQQAAIREACRHLIDAFDQHHEMVESSWNEDAQRGRATCRCGYEAEEKTETGAEITVELHAEWLRETLPTKPAAA